MANYLFLVGMYYPRSSANGVCCKNIVNELIKQGHRVTCVVNADINRGKDEYIDGAQVLRVKPRLSYRLQEWSYYHPESRYTLLINKLGSLLNKISLFTMYIFWPKISPRCTYRFYKRAQKICSIEQFDAVVAVYTPIETLYAGYLLKRKIPEIKFIPYYLDALAGGWGPSKWSSKKTDRRTRKLERKIDIIADMIISMRSSEKYHTTYPLTEINLNKRIYLDVPTYVENTIHTVKSDNKSCQITVIYSGSIHFPDRDPRPLLRHFLKLCEDLDVVLVFIGNNNCPFIFEDYSKKSGGRIKLLGQLSHENAVLRMQEADFFVNIGNTNPNTVPSKIFEYIQFGKPIISTYLIEDEPSIRYLKKYGNYFLLDERETSDFETQNNKLRDFLCQKDDFAERNDNKALFYENTPQAFIDNIVKFRKQ